MIHSDILIFLSVIIGIYTAMFGFVMIIKQGKLKTFIYSAIALSVLTLLTNGELRTYLNARLGWGQAQQRLAVLYFMGGKYIKKDPINARYWAQKASSNGYLGAHVIEGLIDAEGGKKDLAKEHFTRATSVYPHAYYLAGLMDLDDHSEMSQESALTNFEKAAKLGDNMALLQLGIYSGTRLGDRHNAFKYLKIAAEQGNAYAKYELATDYLTFHKDPAISPDKAFQMAAKAVNEMPSKWETKNGLECQILSTVYWGGGVCPKDPIEALKWYELSGLNDPNQVKQIEAGLDSTAISLVEKEAKRRAEELKALWSTLPHENPIAGLSQPN